MDWSSTSLTGSYPTTFPKIDLHRHLEGTLRPATINAVISQYQIPIPAGANIQQLTRIEASDEQTFVNFLSKFQTLRQLYCSPEIITRITREAIQDASNDQVRYLELRFTPAALARARAYPLDEVIGWVCAAARQAGQEFNLPTRLIVSVNRHESIDLAEQVVALAVERQADGIVGLDLAGNEAEFPAAPFLGLFHEAQQAGLRLTIHAGEWGPGANVLEAIRDFNADRIGHGVRVLEDDRARALAVERQTPFEVCLTSNVQSGIFANRVEHPFRRMRAAGLNASLHTDDPAISQITLSDEYQAALEEQGLTRAALAQCVLAAAQAAFLPPEEKQALLRRLAIEFDLLEES